MVGVCPLCASLEVDLLFDLCCLVAEFSLFKKVVPPFISWDVLTEGA